MASLASGCGGLLVAKVKSQYVCSECGEVHGQWQGQCRSCGQWNTLKAFNPETGRKKNHHRRGYAGLHTQLQNLSQVQHTQKTRLSTGLSELDLVLGGGLVVGSVVLIGGDPGIGKSTILLQVASFLSQQGTPVVYITGEESLGQVSLRAQRIGLQTDQLQAMAETQIEKILQTLAVNKPQVLIIDSIQTMVTESASGAPGGVAQVREAAAALTQYAKQNQVSIFLVGHVTKSGEVAGPRVLEHIVDTVLYFEGQQDSRFRALRAMKNRFGAANELGIFAMSEQGLLPVKNPSAIFLNPQSQAVPGTVVMSLWEGSRPLLVELQSLVDTAHYGAPKRVSIGLDNQRLAMLLAVLHRHGGVEVAGMDIYLNLVGGVKVNETSADLPSLLAIVSSLQNRVLPHHLVVFGEVGLSGEIRPVRSGLERLWEAHKQGFTHAIVPQGNTRGQLPEGMTIIPVQHIQQAVSAVNEISLT